MVRLCRTLGMITLALLLVRCGSSEAPQQQAVTQATSPEASIARSQAAPDPTGVPTILRGHIIPNIPSAASTLAVDVHAVDPMGKSVALEYQWFVGGYPIDGATGPRLPPGSFARGDEVSVEVTPMADGRVGLVWTADPVEIGNSPPHVSGLGIQPSPATRREPLKVVVNLDDPDGDEVTVSYQWIKNGMPISGATQATLDPSHYGRGDLLSVEIVATDGEDSTPPLRSAEVDVLPAAPKFVSQAAPTNWKDGRFRYQAQAVHPDGGALQYTLSENAPQGMRINSKTGLVEWEPDPSQSGNFVFQIIVEDPEGARVAQPITLTIEKPPEGQQQ